MVYKWASGSIHKVSAQVAGEICAELAKNNALTAQNLVLISRPEDAPLHNEFEWDNDVAAELYRNQQGSAIIRHITIVSENVEPVRAFFPVEVKPAIYESIQTIIKQEDKYAALMEQAEKELRAIQRKFNMLSELKSVFDAIDEFFEKGA